MTEELARAVAGLPVAVLAPSAVPALAWSRRRRLPVVVLLAAYALVPLLDGPRGWVLLAAAIGMGAALSNSGCREADRRSGTFPAALVAGLALALAAAVVGGAESAYATARDLIDDPQVAHVAFGALASVFVAGSAIGWLLAPIADRIEGPPPGFVNAGRYIGWLERALVFGFIAAGEPAAAALTLTAKSVARFPTFSSGQEALAEYVLIGTLLSFLVAAAGAVAVRAALGLPAL